MILRVRICAAALALGALACGGGSGARPAVAPTPVASATPGRATAAPADGSAAGPAETKPKEPIFPPQLAFMAGLMPLHSTGVDRFQAAHATFDGRGVLIAILDSGVDPGVPGLITTSTGAPKILDLRDFSGEGHVALAPLPGPAADGTVTVAGRVLRGAGRISRLAVGSTWYGGVFSELPLGPLPAADVNGNGTNTDAFPVVVVKAVDGWVVFFDSNLNGTFEDEMPLHDYRLGRETIALGRQPLTLVANFTDSSATPDLELYFDTSGHGTHVAGIASGYRMFNVPGFNGVAPGAQIIGLKIANNARGGISVSGSMERALAYAARFAGDRALPLVITMSFGVGNELEGRATIDSIVGAFLAAHPSIAFTISAGNDGPGLSTMGFPASTDLALSVGALEPGVFTAVPQPGAQPPPDLMGWWSSRGGELAKPDLLTPGQAFSTVPAWNVGDEDKTGTSMAAPHAAGLVACLLSAMVQESRTVSAAELGQALEATASPLPGWTVLDQGAGVPRLEAAYRWLVAGHQGSRYVVRVDSGTGVSAVFRRDGLTGPGDTLARFAVHHVDGYRAARFALRSDASWLQAPDTVTAGPYQTSVTVHYHGEALSAPGLYVGTVTARNPGDTLAGPLFRLITTIVVPYDLDARPLADSARTIVTGRTQRYFLRIRHPGSTLHIAAVVADSERALVMKLHEPSGQPARGNPGQDTPLGFGRTSHATLEVPAEDVVAGVYELDLTALTGPPATVEVTAAVAPVAMQPGGGGFVEVSDPGDGTVTGKASVVQVGAERSFSVTGSGAAAESLRVTAPAWAAEGEVEVEMPRPQWNWFTDFGVTVYDSTGQQVHAEPMNYAFERQRFTIEHSLVGQTLQVELLPGFAHVTSPPPAWVATVRIRFLAATPQPLAGDQDVTVVPGGRTALRQPPVASTGLTEGFIPFLEWRIRVANSPDAVRHQAIP